MAKQKRKKEKNLKPSFREKKRYLLLGINNKDKVEEAILDYIGELGFAKASPNWVKGQEKVLAVNRGEVDKVKAALELNNIKVKKVSGSLKKIDRKL